MLEAAVAADEDWARYEETLIANGEAELAQGDDPALRAWVEARAGALGAPGRQGHAGLRAAHPAAGLSRASRSSTIRAVAPQIRWSPTW